MCSQSVEIKYSEKVYKAYEAAEQETEKYIYSELVMGSENVNFSYTQNEIGIFERDVPLIIMVATNERDIASQYENLVQNEGEVVYLIDEENKVLSSNKEDEIGSYIDEKITECDTGEVYLNETYMMTSREVENFGKGSTPCSPLSTKFTDKKCFGRDTDVYHFGGYADYNMSYCSCCN